MIAPSTRTRTRTTRVSADDWFAAGERRPYDPSRGVLRDPSTRDQQHDGLAVFARVVREPATLYWPITSSQHERRAHHAP